MAMAAMCWSGNARDIEVTCTQTNKCPYNHARDNLEHVLGLIKYRIASMLYRIYTIVSIQRLKLYCIYTETRDMPRHLNVGFSPYLHCIIILYVTAPALR
jgi:hypothetical protein